jgi:hypothetical protein
VLLYVLLAGKRVQDEPPQSGLIAVPEVVVGTSRVGLLRERGKRKYRGQDQRYGYAILHMIFLPEAPLQPDSDKYLEPGNQVLIPCYVYDAKRPQNLSSYCDRDIVTPKRAVPVKKFGCGVMFWYRAEAKLDLSALLPWNSAIARTDAS